MKIVKQVLSILFVRWAVIVLSFITGIFVARAVGPEGRGLLAVLNSSTVLLSVLAGFGLPISLTYLYKQKQYSLTELIISVIIFWGVVVVAMALLLLWQYDALTQYLLRESHAITLHQHWLWLSFATLPGLLIASLLSVVLVIDDKTKLYVVWNLSSQLVTVGLIWITAILLKWGITGVLIANLAGQLVTIGVLVRFLWSIKLIKRLKMLWPSFIRMFFIGFQQYYVTLFATIFKRGEIILLLLLLDLKSVGYYAIATSLYDLLIDIPRSVTIPMSGAIADAQKLDRAENTARSVRLQLFVMLVPTMGLALIGPIFIPIIYGPSFQAALVPFLCLLPGILFRTMHLGAYSYFIGVGKPGAVSMSVIIGAIISLGLDVILVPHFGLVGAAIGTVIAEFCMAAISIGVFLRDSQSHFRSIFVMKRSELVYTIDMIHSLLSQWKHKATIVSE